ncbi:MAG: DNA polymerase III subunit alpha [Candidatus Paceibacterota bacterium]
MSQITHLHTHSHYSLLSALPKIPELVERAGKHNLSALALTDSNNLYGAIEFYKACQAADIKPIIGAEMYVAPRTRHDKQAGVDKARDRVILLVKNEVGYKNLIRLVTDANLEGFYYTPRIDTELMKKHQEGLIAILPAQNSEVTDALKADDTQRAIDAIEKYRGVYGPENTYLEITRHPEIPGYDDATEKIVPLAKKTDTPLVAGHDIFYLDPDDHQACQTLRDVQSAGGDFMAEGGDFSFLSPKEMKKRFKDLPEALDNIDKIVAACNLELELGNWVFPDIETTGGRSYDEELKTLVYDGIPWRELEKTDKLVERIEYELGIIRNKGYSSYFLVVADLLAYARENDILTTIRGSVAGSLVTYLAGITNLNPLDYGLQFERFLNPDRPSAPDIDMDFADNRRDEVIQYARRKYGTDTEERVAQIGTFGTMAARGSIRDVTRALGYNYSLGDDIAKKIPLGSQGFKMTIERALDESDDLAEMYKDDPKVREIVDMAQKVEGCARHISVHAAGVVIAPEEITNYVPLEVDSKKGEVITQYDMHSVEDAGLVKFDFLGLKNLAILSDAIHRVEDRTGERIDIEKIPLDDENTFEMLGEGHTHSTFQLNGEGMTQFLQKLKPTNINDINAMVALYRPGPMKFIPEYIKRKHNPELVDYPHEDLKEFLEQSYGLLIYQEDVMLTAIHLAGYSWLDADKFRKAMGKKIPELMAKQEQKFKEGCVKNGIKDSLADNLWERIKPFAAYAFNKAHAASYGRVAYQTAYMKANYPKEYMAAVLTADAGNVEKIHDIIGECERMGLDVLPPDINESFGTFTIVDEGDHEAIRFGLFSVKHVGEKITQTIIDEREKHGKFSSLEDLLTRITGRNFNKKTLEALIKCGALDSLGKRYHMLAHIDEILTFSKEADSRSKDQQSLFGAAAIEAQPKLRLSRGEPHTKETKLAWEKDLLGLYVSGHPLDKIREKLEKREKDIAFIKKYHKKMPKVVIPGLLESINVIRTKKGDEMAFVRVADLSDSIEIVVFPDAFEKYKDSLVSDSCVVVEGKISNRNNEVSVILDRIKIL